MQKEDKHNSIAIRTAWPPLNHPLSDQPDTRTKRGKILINRDRMRSKIDELIDCTVSFRTTGANRVAEEIACTSSRHLR